MCDLPDGLPACPARRRRLSRLERVLADHARDRLVREQDEHVSGNLFYGNLVAGSCPSSAVIYAAGWNASYNVWSGTAASNTICSGDTTSAFNATINVTGSSDVLANCTQMASNFVPPQKIPGIPTRDIVGNARPKNLVADAGANENC